MNDGPDPNLPAITRVERLVGRLVRSKASEYDVIIAEWREEAEDAGMRKAQVDIEVEAALLAVGPPM